MIGRDVQIYTDHAALAFDFRVTSLQHRTYSFWWSSLSRFRIKIAHIEGVKNGLADYISRVHLLDEALQDEANQSHPHVPSVPPSQSNLSVPSVPPSQTSAPSQVSSFFSTIESSPRRYYDVFAQFSDESEEDWIADESTESQLINAEEEDPNASLWDDEDSPSIIEMVNKFTANHPEFDRDMDPTMEKQLLSQINEFLEHEMLPLVTLTNIEDRRQVITELHRFHANPKAMRAAMLARGVTWSGAWKDCVRCVARCESCQFFNSQKVTHPRLSPLTAVKPMSIVNMDLLGPIDWQKVNKKHAIAPFIGESVDAPKGVKRFYVILCVCVCTGFLHMRVIEGKSSSEIKTALSNVFDQFGYPGMIVADQERSFTSKEIRDWLKEYNTEFRHSTTYTPRTNGMVERRVGIVKAIMKRLIYDKTFNFENWQQSISQIQFHLNARLDRDSGYSPFMLMLGRYPTGGDGVANTMRLNPNFDFVEWNKQFNFVLFQAIPHHCASVVARKRQSIEYYERNNNVETKPLDIDQPIYLRNMVRKFGDVHWSGPYYVCHIRKTNDGLVSAYKLRTAGGRYGELVRDYYPRDQLKTIHDETDARRVDTETRLVAFIYNHHTVRNRGRFFLIRYHESDDAEWVSEDHLSTGLVSDYLKEEEVWKKSKRPTKNTPHPPFSLQMGFNPLTHPFMFGGYIYRPNEDESHTPISPTRVEPRDIPPRIAAMMDYNKAHSPAAPAPALAE